MVRVLGAAAWNAKGRRCRAASYVRAIVADTSRRENETTENT